MPHLVPKDERTTRNYVPFWTADDLAGTREIPTYLFRLTAPATEGTTTETHICPPSPRNENLLDLDSCIAADQLFDHLKWIRNHETSCNLMSWSSSLLLLIQYAFYHYTSSGLKSAFSDIKLFIVDTRRLPKGTFAKDEDLLSALDTACECGYHRNLKKFIKMRSSKYYFGEYLTQGSLNLFKGECLQVSFQEMIDLGLFELLPTDLKDERNWTKWAKPVVWSRRPLYYHRNTPSASEDEVNAAIAIAKGLFKGPWSLSVATMLLGLKPRQRNDPVICKGSIEGYGKDVIRDMILQGLIIDGERLPEVQQYWYIIRDIASAVLENDKPVPSDSGISTMGDHASVSDLTTRIGRLDLGLTSEL